MPEEDIYGSEKKYLRFIANLHSLIEKPKQDRKTKYYCKNKENLAYFEKLDKSFRVKNISFVRRLRLFATLKFIVFATEKDLRTLTIDDWDNILLFMHGQNWSERYRKDFFIDKDYIFLNLFGEKSGQFEITKSKKYKIDPSRQKAREDKLTPEEYEKLVNFFNDKPNIQCFIAVSFENLGRPQEKIGRAPCRERV